MYGYKFNKKGEIIGEIDTLRYSALDSWLKSKDSYRKRYYQGQSFQTRETVFGHEGHKKLENGEVVLPRIPMYATKEYNIEVHLGKKDPVKIGGCIDSFCPETLSFLDYKFSHRNKEGKAPWDRVKVARHMQMVFYGLLIELKHGKVNPKTMLVWVETAFRDKSHSYQGHTLVAGPPELQLTGEWLAIERKVAKWERERLKKIIKEEAKKIQDDFKRYKDEHRQGASEPSDDGNGEAVPREGTSFEEILRGDAKKVGSEEKA